MKDKTFRRVISSILLLSAIVALSLVFIASSTYEVVLALALSMVAGSLGLFLWDMAGLGVCGCGRQASRQKERGAGVLAAAAPAAADLHVKFFVRNALCGAQSSAAVGFCCS